MGRRREEGVGDLERESWKSGGGVEEVEEEEVVVVVVMVDRGGVGVTTNSRHCGLGLVGKGPVGVVRVEGEGRTDWKAWMGSASKNSWAKMKGVLVGSVKELFSGQESWKRGSHLERLTTVGHGT